MPLKRGDTGGGPSDIAGQIDESKIGDAVTPFGVVQTASQTPQFAIDPSHGLTRSRYGWFSNGTRFDGTNVSETPGSIQLQTSATATDIARLRSAYPGQYVSQAVAQPGVALVIGGDVVHLDSDNHAFLASGKIITGSFIHDGTSVTDGIGFQFDPSGVKAFLKSNGSHQANSPVRQGNWNIDNLDGTGDSGIVLDPARGYIYNFPYTWYNQGAIFVGLIDPASNEPVMAHKFIVNGEPSMATPNLETQAVIDNDGDASQLTAEVGGMQYTLYGATGSPEVRKTDESRITANNFVSDSKATNNNAVDPDGQAGVPLVSIQRESGNRDIRISLDDFIADANNDIYVYFWDEYDPDTALTGETFNAPESRINDSESDIVTDTQATGYSPTTATFRGFRFIPSGKNDPEPVSPTGIDDRIPLEATRVITAVNDGTNADITPFQVEVAEGF